MEQELIKKINCILEKYRKIDAKSWEIGTDFYKSCSMMLEKLRQIQNLENDMNIHISEYHKHPNANSRYQLKCHRYNVTPSKKKFVSKSAIRQYLQELSALGFLNYSQDDKLHDGVIFELIPDILSNIENNIDDLLVNQIVKVIFRSIDSEIYYERNLGFSLFICMLYEYYQRTQDNIFLQLNNIEIVSIKKKGFRKHRPFYLYKPSTINYIGHLYGINVDGLENNKTTNGKKTYITAINKVISKYELSSIIIKMYDIVLNPNNELHSILSIEEENNKKKRLLFKEIIEKLQNYRSQLRKNIIDTWVINQDKYTDLENSPSNELPVYSLEACHIYDVENIAKDIWYEIQENNTINVVEKYLYYVKDHNNGILLNPTSHKLFDRRIVWFDLDGRLRWRSESIDVVKNIFGENCDQICIKQERLNQAMKNYLAKRRKPNQG